MMLKVPDRQLTLILLASSDRASSPFGLGSGDPARSPFVTAFLTRSAAATKPGYITRAAVRTGQPVPSGVLIGRQMNRDSADQAVEVAQLLHDARAVRSSGLSALGHEE
jgi:hypothetical protein